MPVFRNDNELDCDWETFKLCAGSEYDDDERKPPVAAVGRANVAPTNANGENKPSETYETETNYKRSNSPGHTHHTVDTGFGPSEKRAPTCTPIYISTTTKIAYLNAPINIKAVFWEIPIVKYTDTREGVIKKQIKFSTTDRDEYERTMDRISKERYADNQEMEHIDNPEGRIKFKDQRKISIGMSKKDILCYRSKRKRAFFNCFVLILRIHNVASDEYKEMHVKVFNTGKLEIPGIQTDNMLEIVIKMVVQILRPVVCDSLDYIQGRCDTVLINSNFNCGFYINRDRLHDLLKYKYRINSNYDSCSYPGIQSKFYYINGNAAHVQTGQQPADGADFSEISFMIFRTGSVLIVGKCTVSVLHVIYDFLKTVLENEYAAIVNTVGGIGGTGNAVQENDGMICRKKPALKVQRRIIIITS
jgi:hypothetical protein